MTKFWNGLYAAGCCTIMIGCSQICSIPRVYKEVLSSVLATTHKQAPAIWLTFCLTTVAVIFPREKAKAIGEAFIKLLGSERVRPLKESKAGLLFKIRDDALNQAKHFSFDRFDFKLIAQTKLARGVIQVPKNADIDKLKNDLKNKSNVEAVHSGL
ncbi:hypothetical protein DPMN_083265 [Dreissena polymorpha]|uniref:Uncharacterized protein n=1 Tax=Dreissena polymorpha TaxID=45954 RepID=A0A9D3YAU5_DREPO|nr:hypothetical protein DPMN_083265 [Dreissena polymorpha]